MCFWMTETANCLCAYIRACYPQWVSGGARALMKSPYVPASLYRIGWFHWVSSLHNHSDHHSTGLNNLLTTESERSQYCEKATDSFACLWFLLFVYLFVCALSFFVHDSFWLCCSCWDVSVLTTDLIMAHVVVASLHCTATVQCYVSVKWNWFILNSLERAEMLKGSFVQQSSRFQPAGPTCILLTLCYLLLKLFLWL